MQPLLKIQNIPISIEYKVQRAQLQQQSTPAKLDITRSRGSLNIQTTKPQMKVDSYETRASAGIKSPVRTNQEFGEAGVAAGHEATRQFAEEGNARLESAGSKTHISDMITSKMIRPAETTTAFVPSQKPEITVEPGSISFDVSMDKLTFDWSINHKPQLEFVPASIEFSVAQYPEVKIEYMGAPIYVPPSADPNYDPPAGQNVDATV